ncbi:ribonuclease P protein subunit p25-like protein [Anopheles cruzii]|uniref:ribonuclease P protein subunit p25-like protein n=1 Tax=Anopheles cruzii TaxID=68878 RepID=UPI0022EC437D|nr:ribonuclease P protein subunit p25-like protein [Anopheles cruzii]
MMHYKKGKNVEQELSQEQIPIEVLPERFLWMHVKGGSSVKNLTEHAKQALTDGSYRSVVWSGSDGGVGKTISCAEILKRDFELHQVTRICYRKVEEFWDPLQEGLEQIVAKRNIPCVHILESLDAIDAGTPGYQHSKSQAGFWVEAVGVDGTTKRPQGQRRPRDGEKKGNYFTGPQLKKKANRHYGNGRQDDEAGAPNGSQQQRRDRSVDKGKAKPPGGNTPGDGSRKKGKPKDGNRNNPKNGSHEAAATSTGQPKD